MYTMMRLTFYDGNGFDFAYALSDKHPLLFYVSMCYLCVTSFGMLNGLVGIFGTAFTDSRDTVYQGRKSHSIEDTSSNPNVSHYNGHRPGSTKARSPGRSDVDSPDEIGSPGMGGNMFNRHSRIFAPSQADTPHVLQVVQQLAALNETQRALLCKMNKLEKEISYLRGKDKAWQVSDKDVYKPGPEATSKGVSRVGKRRNSSSSFFTRYFQGRRSHQDANQSHRDIFGAPRSENILSPFAKTDSSCDTIPHNHNVNGGTQTGSKNNSTFFKLSPISALDSTNNLDSVDESLQGLELMELGDSELQWKEADIQHNSYRVPRSRWNDGRNLVEQENDHSTMSLMQRFESSSILPVAGGPRLSSFFNSPQISGRPSTESGTLEPGSDHFQVSSSARVSDASYKQVSSGDSDVGDDDVSLNGAAEISDFDTGHQERNKVLDERDKRHVRPVSMSVLSRNAHEEQM
jgi:hypothetical protein